MDRGAGAGQQKIKKELLFLYRIAGSRLDELFFLKNDSGQTHVFRTRAVTLREKIKETEKNYNPKKEKKKKLREID